MKTAERKAMVERAVTAWVESAKREIEADAPRRETLFQMRLSIERGIYAEVMELRNAVGGR